MKRNENNDFNLVAEIQTKVDELEDQEEVAVATVSLKGSNNSENYVKNIYNSLKGAGIQKLIQETQIVISYQLRREITKVHIIFKCILKNYVLKPIFIVV